MKRVLNKVNHKENHDHINNFDLGIGLLLNLTLNYLGKCYSFKFIEI